MRLAKHALLIALVTLAMVFAVSAQTRRAPEDNRNIAPTVGTGGTPGGPTGLFTVYDGQTLRRGEYTFSIAYSNFDRDPGNVDFTEIPVSFQIGLSDNLELFFNTDAYRGIKVNNPENLSSFYLPNSQINVGTIPAAIVLAPGTSGQFANLAVFRPAGTGQFALFPFSGANAGTFGLVPPFFSGNVFGFANNANATLGPVRAGGAADNFPGVGSPFGSILPGIVLQTQNLTCANGAVCGTAPVVYSVAPSYLPDAPFINRRWGQSAFGTLTFGAKWRFNSVESPFGWGLVAYYKWYLDNANDAGGFNQLQRGASPGGNRGDIGVNFFWDARAATWANVSFNAGYVYTSDVKGEFPNGTFTLLSRGDEFNYGIGVDFPVNKHFQPILEFKQTIYVGGRTPNVFENDPQDALAGVRIFPKRWFGMSFAYRYHVNSQNDTDDATFSQSVRTFDFPRIIANNAAGIPCTTANDPTCTIVAITTPITTSGPLSNAFRTSSDPHGFLFQFFAGRRNARGLPPEEVPFADVTDVAMDQSEVILPCPPGMRSTSGACADDRNVGIRTSATNPKNDPLTYNYTVSGGRIVGQGANVNWDLSGVRAGTYTITAAVDNGCGFCGKTQTKTIVVRECPDCVKPCECATIDVQGPSGITPLDGTMTFTASVTGGTQTSVTYNWTVSAGNIVSGQGTPTITVQVNPDLAAQTITATVDVGGLCPECTRTDSASGEVAPKPPNPRKVDEFGKLPNDDIRGRLDGYFNELNADPSAKAYIIITAPTPREQNRLEKLVNDHLAFRGQDASKFTIVKRDGPEVNIQLWVVPAGAENPQ